jgi:alpha-L-rhamnosidase
LVLGPSSREAVYLTFEFAEQVVGWPFFTIDAPEGTIVELITQESHDPARTAWLDSHFYTWARFVCRAGANRFETFDFESLRWLQLHIRPKTTDQRPKTKDQESDTPSFVLGPSSLVTVSDVGVRRRVYPWPNEPDIATDDPVLARLFGACVNTLHNCAQETCVDGMGRERQQYSGDGGHQLAAIRYTFGETRLPRRFLETFALGQSPDGYFLDCWPAYDRLARVMQRQVGATGWGPLLDHGVGFVFDCWKHYLETADLDVVEALYPRLRRFASYLERLRGTDNLLPVENLGVPAVWIDHEAYQRQRHKQCAFNLYVAAMLGHALAPLARACGDAENEDYYVNLSLSLRAAVVARFWDAGRGLFVNNLPWLAEEGAPRLCDRSLATALLFDQCPNELAEASLRALAERPPELGISYPANAPWRYWALARHGRADVVLGELRARWATMDSVLHNNTVQEFWQARPDTADQWSHCAVAPLLLLFEGIAGIQPTGPGFARCRIRPQLGDLGQLALAAHTVRGPIRFTAAPARDGHDVTISLPAGCAGELVRPGGAPVELEAGATAQFWLPNSM